MFFSGLVCLVLVGEPRLQAIVLIVSEMEVRQKYQFVETHQAA
jgi:hypothetical protein